MFSIIACCIVDVVLLWVSTRIRVNSASHFISCSHFRSQFPQQKRGLRLRPNVLSYYLRPKIIKKTHRVNVLWLVIALTKVYIFVSPMPPRPHLIFSPNDYNTLPLWNLYLVFIFLGSISICALMLLGLWPYILYVSCMW